MAGKFLFKAKSLIKLNGNDEDDNIFIKLFGKYINDSSDFI